MTTTTLPRATVRFATREDVPVIVSLIREAAEHEGRAQLVLHVADGDEARAAGAQFRVGRIGHRRTVEEIPATR